MARIKLNSAGVKELLNSEGVRADLTRRAGRVLTAAQLRAPVSSGDYKGSLRIIQATTDRAVVRVGSDAPHAGIVEANTGNLARALDSAW